MSDAPSRQLECFKTYVASGRAPRWTMAPSDIHGFLTGLAMAGPLPRSKWTDWVWSGENPQFISSEEARNVMDDLLACEQQVRGSIGSYRLVSAAVLPRAANGRLMAADWAEGFLQAIEANPQPWQVVVEHAEASLSAVLTTCYDNHDENNDGSLDPDELDAINLHLRSMYRLMQTDESRMTAGLRAA
jgi:yecA family protein